MSEEAHFEARVRFFIWGNEGSPDEIRDRIDEIISHGGKDLKIGWWVEEVKKVYEL